jgi:hypothetical protein
MASFILKFNTKDAERAMQRLRERAPQAIARALNRSAASARTAMVRVISQDTGISQADLRGTTTRNRRIWTRDATATDQQVTVYATSAPIPLIDYRATGPEPSRGKGRGVRARLKGGAGRYPRAFIATMGSGHRGVFERPRSSRRLPIYELHGPSIAHVWEKHAAIGVARGQEQLVKNLQSEFRFALRKGA